MGEHRLTRITTRTGDDGSTGLADGTRLAKTSARIVAMGDVDELNACLGLLCVAPGIAPSVLARLRQVQHELFDVGGELSLPGRTLLARAALATLETDIAAWNAALPPLTEFVLPGSDEANARAHIARTVCRRAERTLWEVAQQEGEALSPDLPRYLNRLSDWLFVLSRLLARQHDATETVWRTPPAKGSGDAGPPASPTGR